ncbi:MAG: hypothetical protein LBQ55_07320 [Treponema sp.]|jgi:integrase|nr:hypothetical protein [Treponema sp.]
MPRIPKPFITPRRNDAKTFQISLNAISGLPERICQQWKHRSFQDFPPELAQFRNPRTKAAAEAGGYALIQFLKNHEAPAHVSSDKFLVGEYLGQFTDIEKSPRGAELVAEARSYSLNTIDRYRGLYNIYIKDDVFAKLPMFEVEKQDALNFISRLSRTKMVRRDKQTCYLQGTETMTKIIKFIRMAFKEYGTTHEKWHNAFRDIKPPKARDIHRDAFDEDEVVSLFRPGVLQDTMDLCICSAMFLSGLRRGEIFAIKPEDLDWHTPKIKVRRAWQRFDYRARELGPTKSKKERAAPFDEVLQEAIKKLWEENGQY